MFLIKQLYINSLFQDSFFSLKQKDVLRQKIYICIGWDESKILYDDKCCYTSQKWCYPDERVRRNQIVRVPEFLFTTLSSAAKEASTTRYIRKHWNHSCSRACDLSFCGGWWRTFVLQLPLGDDGEHLYLKNKCSSNVSHLKLRCDVQVDCSSIFTLLFFYRGLFLSRGIL